MGLRVTKTDLEIADLVATCYDDPLRFVQLCYPWGESGPLQDYDGPDVWQAEILSAIGRQVYDNAFNGKDAVNPIRCAVSSCACFSRSERCVFTTSRRKA